MKNARWILAAALLLTLTAPLSAQTLSFVSDDWCPYNCEPDGDAPGFAIEASMKIFGEAGMTVDYRLMDWDQSIEETRQGLHNAIIGAAKGEAPDFVFPEESIANASSCFFVRKDDSWTYQGPDSLKERKIAAIEAYDYNSDEIAENTYGNVVRFESLEACVEALLGGQADTFIEDEYVFQLFEFKNHIAGEIHKAGCLDADPVYVAFSPADPKSAEYAALFSKGLAAMKASGDWKALLQKYGIAP